MTYPLFAEKWHLTHTVTTGIFAIYPIVVAAVLVGFGDVSDYIGRRAAMLWGVGASLVGTLLFAVAPDVLWLFAGRAFMGIGVGLTAGSSTAAMVEFSGQGTGKRAPRSRPPPKPPASLRLCCSAVPSFNMLRCRRG
jgi:MFS family permease